LAVVICSNTDACCANKILAQKIKTICRNSFFNFANAYKNKLHEALKIKREKNTL
jgi:hypothetical protein